ncbi:Charged multivesicular body protein 6 [Sparganum proliferum]
MDSPISGLVAELVLQELEKTAFIQHELAFSRRYVDDTFVIVKKDMLQHFYSLLNAVFPDIKFTREEEREQQLPFLDVLVRRNLNGEHETTTSGHVTASISFIRLFFKSRTYSTAHSFPMWGCYAMLSGVHLRLSAGLCNRQGNKAVAQWCSCPDGKWPNRRATHSCLEMGAIFGRHRRSRVTEEDKALLQLKQQRDQLKQYKQRVNAAITRDDAAIRQLLRQQERKKALLLLKKKKYQEKLLVKADEHLTTVEGLIQDVEFAQVQVKVLDSLKKGNEALKQLNALMKLEDVEKIMSDAQEAQAYQEELTNLLAGGLSTSDDAEVESELEQLLAVDTDKLPEVPRTEVPKPEPAEHRAKRAEKPSHAHGDRHSSSPSSSHHRMAVEAT